MLSFFKIMTAGTTTKHMSTVKNTFPMYIFDAFWLLVSKTLAKYKRSNVRIISKDIKPSKWHNQLATIYFNKVLGITLYRA